jgi:hypothetical protein
MTAANETAQNFRIAAASLETEAQTFTNRWRACHLLLHT